MLNYDHNLRDFGYYQVGNQQFINKIEAIIAAEQCHEFPKFVFNDATYNGYNWLQEPAETLDELYLRRALEIRNRYDYLVLHFSGGSDSTNILETFIKNKIPLEEVFLRGPIKTSDKNINNTQARNQYAEIWFNALPLAELVKERYMPNLKITVIDTVDYIVDYYKNNQDWFSLDKGNPFTTFTPGSSAAADWDAINTDLQKLSESGHRVGHIFGVEKPIVEYTNNEWQVKFLDKFINIFFVSRKNSIDLPMYKEAFYWADTTAPMIIKQAHTIKNYIEKNQIDPVWFTQLKGRPKHDFVAKIIYNRQLPLLFNPGKFSGGVVFPWDKFFFSDPNSDHVKNWKTGMQHLSQHIPKKWLHTEQGYSDLIGIYSQSYQIA